MLPSFHKMWAIVEDHTFASELSALIGDPVRADEFVEGAKFALSRKPTTGTQIGKNVWFLPMALHSVIIFYRFDEESVYLLSVRDASLQDEDS